MTLVDKLDTQVQIASIFYQTTNEAVSLSKWMLSMVA
jgi:hypothetical protein